MRPKIVLIVILAAIGLTAAACSDSAPSELTLTPPADWSVAEDLRIGSADDSPTALTSVVSLAVDASGRMYVAQPMDNSIRVFDVDGRDLGTYGRSGDGPGEFRQITRIGIFSDTLYVSDPTAGRITFFALDGRLLETRPLRPQGLGGDWVPLAPWWVDGEGTALALPGFLPALRDPTLGYRVMLVRIDRSGEVVDTVSLTDRPPHQSIRLQGTRGPLLVNQPFSTPALPVVARNGSLVAVLGDVRVPDRDGMAFDITVLRSLRDTVWTQSYAYERIPLTESLVDRVVAAVVGRLSSEVFPDRDGVERQFRLGMSVPGHVPPVSGGVLADDGGLWLRREDMRAEDQRWTVLDHAGTPIGAVVLPSAFTPHVVRRSSLWGVERDELDVPYVVRYTIER